MSKVIISMGYKKFVVDGADALSIMDAIGKAERYERESIRNDDGSYTYSHHVWTENSPDGVTDLSVMPDTLYAMAKLAGKPEK